MMMNTTVSHAPDSDAELVLKSLAGNRDAFGLIVSRYQSLVCSIAYNATGSLTQSEDLAQETFLAAWKQLSHLREPASLRSWLCGISRNLVHNAIRRSGREPLATTAQMDEASQYEALDPLPAEQAISREEEAILWRSLERIPEVYREPLILYYREHRSVESVAQALGLSEEAVRQRLSRGRKLLHEQVLAFVEGALERTGPGKVFTAGVVASLPFLTTSATAATVAATAVKGSTVAKSAGFLALFTLLLGPITWIFSAYLGVRCGLAATKTPRERKFVWQQTKIILVSVGLYLTGVFTLLAFTSFWKQHSTACFILGTAHALLFGAWFCRKMFTMTRQTRELRAEEKVLHPECFSPGPASFSQSRGEYKSRRTFLGIPLVHIHYGVSETGSSSWAIGWIAMGERAAGLLALGNIAVGGITVGTVSAGVFSMGVVSMGFLALGSVSVGLVSLGAMTFGLVSSGAFAVAWTGAAGALAFANDFAVGGHAVALHANDAIAREFFEKNHANLVYQILTIAVAVLSCGPLGWIAWRSRSVTHPQK